MMVLLFIELLLFIMAILYVKQNIKEHFLFCFTMLLYFIYIFLGPLSSLMKSNYVKFGGDFRDYFEDGLFIYVIALLSIFTSYVLSSLILQKKAKEKVKNEYVLRKNYLVIVMIVFLIVTLVSYIYPSGIDQPLSQSNTLSNYFLFLSDSLILMFVILFYERKKNFFILMMCGVSILTFLLLGFRYRILFLIIAYVYSLLINGDSFNVKKISRYLVGFVIIVFVINFISINRYSFKDRNYGSITSAFESPKDLSTYEYFLAQTNNYSTDFNVLRYMEVNHIEHDYGLSLIGHIFIRVTPSSFYLNNKKPPIPQQKIIQSCFSSAEGYFSGSAVTNIFQYYIGFGLFGVMIFMFIFGFIISYISQKWDTSIPRNRVIIVMSAMVVFQEVTRGYLPQVLTHLIYLLLALNLLYKKNRNESI